MAHINCPKAAQFAAFAETYGWTVDTETRFQDGGELATVAASTAWGEPDAGLWRVGIMIGWFRTEHGWRLGEVDGHPVVGTAEHDDGRSIREFWLNSVRQARDVLEDPYEIVRYLDRWTEGVNA